MTDTVTRLMGLADEFMIQERDGTNGYEARQALHDELTRLFTPLNQCDGCMAGQVMRGALHIGDDGKPLMVCQKSKYEVENEANERNLCQLTDELAESRREVAQLQEQNTALDAKLASHEAVMRMALDALNGLFGIPEQWTGQGGGGVSVWRLGGSDQPRAAIKALEEQLK